jgi:hypothetical protein
VEEFSPTFYGFCTVGGILSAGTPHLAITPLDVFKVKMQVISCVFFLFFLPKCLLSFFCNLF